MSGRACLCQQTIEVETLMTALKLCRPLAPEPARRRQEGDNPIKKTGGIKKPWPKKTKVFAKNWLGYYLIAAWAEANLAMGTRNGEQLT